MDVDKILKDGLNVDKDFGDELPLVLGVHYQAELMVMEAAFVDAEPREMMNLVAYAAVVMYQGHDYVDAVHTFYSMDSTSLTRRTM